MSTESYFKWNPIEYLEEASLLDLPVYKKAAKKAQEIIKEIEQWESNNRKGELSPLVKIYAEYSLNG